MAAENFSSSDFHFCRKKNSMIWKSVRRGQSVLVCAEQGFGDTLQFVRYLPILESLGSATYPWRVSLPFGISCEESGCCTEVVAYDKALPEHDYVVPLLSVPRLWESPANTYLRGGTSISSPMKNSSGSGRKQLPITGM